MPLADSEDKLKLLSPLSADRDPLGLTPIPVDNRQRFLRFMLSSQGGEEDSQTEIRQAVQGEDFSEGPRKEQAADLLLPLGEIVEVIQIALEDIFPVPDMPACVLGVCGWRGETLWLVDLSHLTGYIPLYRRPYLVDLPFAMVVQSSGQSLGLVVEQVGEVDLFDEDTIQMEPGLCSPKLEPFIRGYCPQQGGMVLSAAKVIESSIWQAHSAGDVF